MDKLYSILRSVVFIGALLLVPLGAEAQETRTVSGRTYFVHNVQAGQTLYAISSSYAVPIDAIVAANPGVDKGLSIGQELLVPQDAVVRKEVKKAPELKQNGELIHTVQKKETLFGIAQKYGVDVNELMTRNPQVNTMIQPGMDVVIPVVNYAGQPELASRPAAPVNTIPHLVVPGETVFSLGKKYNVSAEQITNVNGGLLGGLKAGEYVFIPVDPATGATFTPVEEPLNKDSIAALQRYKISFLLPFSIPKNDSTLVRTGNEPRYYEPTRIAAQFYAGAKFALDSLRKLGLNADIVVKDMGDDQATWTAVLRDPDIARTDLFLGPFHRTAIEQLARIATRAHIICPVPQSVRMILGNPNISKISPTNTDMVNHSARYVALKHAMDNVIMVRSDLPGDKLDQDQMIATLNSALTKQTSKLRDSLLVVNSVKRQFNNLLPKLDPVKTNVVISTSDDVEFATALVAFLKGQLPKYKIILVGMESWVENANVASSDLDQLGFLFASGAFTDPSDARLVEFTNNFRTAYQTDVDQYALIGFDATFYFVMGLMTQGRQFQTHFNRIRTEPLYTGFRMTTTGPENGFRNEYAIMLQQKDLQLRKAP